MARISARGRSEIVRLEKEQDVDDSDLITWQRTTVTIMSDGKILQKRDVQFKPTTYSPAKKHSYGWKVAGKMKDLSDELVNKFVQQHLAKGYVEIETPGSAHSAVASERLRIERIKREGR